MILFNVTFFFHIVCSKPGIENTGNFSNATVYGKQVTAHVS